MTAKQAIPYLSFEGNASAAIAFYERALAAETKVRMRWAEMPNCPLPPDAAERVMHCELAIGSATIMLSDIPPSMTATGNNVTVCLNFDDPAEVAPRFDALAIEGKVHMGVHDTFWGGKLGHLVDRFGVPWMLVWNPEGPKQPQP